MGSIPIARFRILFLISGRTDRLARAFAALGAGDVGAFEELFAPEARWLGVPGSGMGGETPT